MYQVDHLDRVIKLGSIPQCSIGAPLPLIMSNEHKLLLAYLSQHLNGNVGVQNSSEDAVALLLFQNYYAYMFGPPNDEAIEGHPLADRGLEPYDAFQVQQSSWIRRLERMNSVHPSHDPKQFESLNHYIFTFHDSTFECVADGYNVTIHRGPLKNVLPEMQRLLE